MNPLPVSNELKKENKARRDYMLHGEYYYLDHNKPSQISRAYHKIMRDNDFYADYTHQIAKATIDYYLQILLLHGRWKRDPEIKKRNEQVEYIQQLEKEGILW